MDISPAERLGQTQSAIGIRAHAASRKAAGTAERRPLDTRRSAREAGIARPRWESVGNLCPKHARRRRIARGIPGRRLCIAWLRPTTKTSRVSGRSALSGSTAAGGEFSTGLSAATSIVATTAAASPAFGVQSAPRSTWCRSPVKHARSARRVRRSGPRSSVRTWLKRSLRR